MAWVSASNKNKGGWRIYDIMAENPVTAVNVTENSCGGGGGCNSYMYHNPSRDHLAVTQNSEVSSHPSPSQCIPIPDTVTVHENSTGIQKRTEDSACAVTVSENNCGNSCNNYIYNTPNSNPVVLPAIIDMNRNQEPSVSPTVHEHCIEIRKRAENPAIAVSGNSCSSSDGCNNNYVFNNSALNPLPVAVISDNLNCPSPVAASEISNVTPNTVVVSESNVILKPVAVSKPSGDTSNQSSSASTVHTNPTGIRKRAYTAEFKLQVVAAAKAGTTQSASAAFQVDRKCIRAWRRIEESLISQVENGNSDRRRLNGGGRKPTNRTTELEQAPQLAEQNQLGKRIKRSIALTKKVDIIDLINNGSNQSQVARMMGVNTSTIQTIWSNRDKILARVLLGTPKKKKVRDARFINIDVALLSWYREIRKEKVIIDDKMLTDKANELARFFKESEFTLHVDWVEKWKSKHNITLGSDIHLESESPTQNHSTSTVEAWKCIEQIRYWLVANVDDEGEVDKMYGHLSALERTVMKKRSAELRLRQSHNSSVSDFCTTLLSSSHT